MRRVLIINSTAIGERGGTGITMQNLWCDYPKKCILQLRINVHGAVFDESYKTISTPVEFCRLPNMLSLKRKREAKGQQTSQVSIIRGVSQKGIKNIVRDCAYGILDTWPVRYKSINAVIDEMCIRDRCDVALIPLRKGVIGNGVPSKAPLLMACHKVIINSVEEESAYYRLFNENDMGISVPLNDAQGLADAIRGLAADPVRCARMADNAQAYSEQYYSASVCTKKIMDTFEMMVQKK